MTSSNISFKLGQAAASIQAAQDKINGTPETAAMGPNVEISEVTSRMCDDMIAAVSAVTDPVINI